MKTNWIIKTLLVAAIIFGTSFIDVEAKNKKHRRGNNNAPKVVKRTIKHTGVIKRLGKSDDGKSLAQRAAEAKAARESDQSKPVQPFVIYESTENEKTNIVENIDDLLDW